MIGKTNADGGVGVFSDEATATKKHVLEGATYLGLDTDDELGTGEIPIRTPVTKTFGINDSVTLPAGYYEADSNITQNIPTKEAAVITPSTKSQTITGGQYLSGEQTIASLGGNVPASMVHSSYSFSSDVAGRAVQGTMPNRGGYWGFGNNKGVDAGNQRMWVQVPGGYYDENAQVFLSWADIRNLTGLTPDKIKKGQSIMGIIGSFQGMVDSPLYLLKEGSGQADLPDVSGGMFATPTKVTSWGILPDLERYWGDKHGFYLNVKTRGAGGGVLLVRLSNSIELTAYSRLQLQVSSGYDISAPPACQRFGLSPSGSVTGNNFTSFIDVDFQINQGVYTIDISNLVGGFWFYFYQELRSMGTRGSSESNVRIHKISLWA